MKYLTNNRSHILFSILLLTIFTFQSFNIAQGKKKFAQKGVVELGGNISFMSITPVSNGNTGDAATILTVAPFIGFFITDGFELSVNPLGFTKFGGTFDGSQFRSFLAPSYNFRTNGEVFPFIEGLIGYTSSSNGTSRSGLSYGGRTGIKIPVGENSLLNLGFQYLIINLNKDNNANRYGSNEFSFSAGFSVWL